VTSHSDQLSLLPSADGAVAVLCGREDNRRSGIALSVHHIDVNLAGFLWDAGTGADAEDVVVQG